MAKRSYSKFYALLRKNPRIDKAEMVLQFTDGRTTHLTQMTDAEYEEMVATIETATNNTAEELRRWRSSALLRIGRLGINTIDNWDGKLDADATAKRTATIPYGVVDSTSTSTVFMAIPCIRVL